MLLEYNVRMGDPEAEVTLPMIKNDFLSLVQAACKGHLEQIKMDYHEGAAVGISLTSKGYPGRYSVAYEIRGLEELNADTLLFHAGTKLSKGRMLTYGGRVLQVVCRGDSLEEAVEKVYSECEKIDFQGISYRKDIGRQLLLV